MPRIPSASAPITFIVPGQRHVSRVKSRHHHPGWQRRAMGQGIKHPHSGQLRLCQMGLPARLRLHPHTTTERANNRGRQHPNPSARRQ